jgi:superfamily I DNA/RNA helicase
LSKFDEHFEGVGTLHLTRNFRSSETIVKAASTILDGNPMNTTNPPGQSITLLEHLNEEQQAERIGEIVSDLIREGTKPKEIAILFRKNHQADLLAWELFARGIPFEEREDSRRRPKDKVSMSFLGQMILNSFESALALMLMLLWRFLTLTRKRNKVWLLTMHAAKGCEFEHVIVSHLIQEECFVGDEEEERRLFFVAVSRAKNKLYLSHFGYPNSNLANLIRSNGDLIEAHKRPRVAADGEYGRRSIFG